MHFSVVAITSVPDVAGTRRLFGLSDLDDESAAKVLFHHRRQQTGSSEVLRWDQRTIAGITVIRHAVDEVRIESMTRAEHDEPAMLHAFYQSVLRDTLLVTWGGKSEALPVIHFRTLLHEVSYPRYWQASRDCGDAHRDLREWLAPEATDSPELDETARRLGLPGLLQQTEDDACAAWLRGDYAPVQSYSELTAINTYLVALRLFAVSGEVSSHDTTCALDRLREQLRVQKTAHCSAFLAAWDGS